MFGSDELFDDDSLDFNRAPTVVKPSTIGRPSFSVFHFLFSFHLIICRSSQMFLILFIFVSVSQNVSKPKNVKLLVQTKHFFILY